jgi:hypothetical protein
VPEVSGDRWHLAFPGLLHVVPKNVVKANGSVAIAAYTKDADAYFDVQLPTTLAGGVIAIGSEPIYYFGLDLNETGGSLGGHFWDLYFLDGYLAYDDADPPGMTAGGAFRFGCYHDVLAGTVRAYTEPYGGGARTWLGAAQPTTTKWSDFPFLTLFLEPVLDPTVGGFLDNLTLITEDLGPQITIDDLAPGFLTDVDHDPAGQTLHVTNGDGGTLDGLSLGPIVYDQLGPAWLALSLGSTTAPADIAMTVHSLGELVEGVYTAHFDVLSTAATNSPQTVHVTLQVTPGAAVASDSTAVVPGTGRRGDPVVITVTARNGHGTPVGHGGDPTGGTVTGGPNVGSFVGSTDNGDGTYTLTYTPTSEESGVDELAITLDPGGGGHPAPIADSPFFVRFPGVAWGVDATDAHGQHDTGTFTSGPSAGGSWDA